MRYGAAVLLTLAALGVSLLLRPWIAHTVVIFFFAAVFAAAWVGGRGPMALSTVLGAVLAQVWMFEPAGAMRTDAPSVVSLGMFVLVAAFADALMGRLRDARAEAELRATESAAYAEQMAEQAAELEAQVAESEALAEELEHSNEALLDAQEDVRRARERAERLQRVTAEFSRAATVTAVADAVVRNAVDAMEAAAGVFAVQEPGADEARVLRFHNFAPQVAERWRTLPLSAALPLTEALRTGEPVWVGSRDELVRRFPELAEVRGNAAWAVLPVRVEGRVAAAIGLSFQRPGPFPPEDRALMRMLAEQCGQALQRARLFDAEREARLGLELAERRVALLAEVSGRLSSTLDLDEALSRLAALVVPELADGCLVHLLAGEDGPLRLAVAAHRDSARAATLEEVQRRWPPTLEDGSGCGRVVREADDELVGTVSDASVLADARDGEHAAALRELELGSTLCVPIMLQDRVLGGITLLSHERGRFGEADLRLARAVAGRAGQAIDNARIFQGMQAANQAKADFLAVMSHELRTPLNAIMGFSDLLLMGVPEEIPPDACRQVERVRVAAGHLLQLVEEVLSYSRMEAGKEAFRAVPTDLERLVRETAALLDPLAQSRGLELRVEVDGSVPEASTDPGKVRQIVTNLLSNAVKFTPDGHVGVRLAVQDGQALLEVEDSGIGIAPEHLEHIFEPFWQADRGATRRFGGTGLGLGVARRLARLLGGELTVESTVGEGSTFVLRLPLAGAGGEAA